MKIVHRKRIVINTDPQRRCYYGCNAKEETVWTEWATLETLRSTRDPEERLKFWRELNDYAVSQRGPTAKSEFKLVN